MASALLPALRAQTDIEVVGIVAGTLSEAQSFAAAHHIGRAYATLPELLEAEKQLNLGVIATPDHVHAEAVSALLSAGVAAYCEKPLANSAGNAQELVALGRRTGVTATVGYSFRFNPALQALKRDLAAGRLGEPWLIELAEHNPQFHLDSGKPLNWKGDPAQAAGGALFEYGSHVIDMAAWLLGPIARVSSSLKRVLPGARLDDIATLQMQFQNGSTGLLISSWVLSGGFPGIRIRLHGSQALGEVWVDDRLEGGQCYRLSPALGSGGEDQPIEPMRGTRTDAVGRHMAALLSAIRGDGGGNLRTLPTLEQAAHVQDVLEASLNATSAWQDVTGTSSPLIRQQENT
jgi:predicted dehydrogenase